MLLPEQACVSEVKNRRYDTRESVKRNQIQKQPLGVRRICSLSSLTSKLGCSSSDHDKQHVIYTARCHLPYAEVIISLNWALQITPGVKRLRV